MKRLWDTMTLMRVAVYGGLGVAATGLVLGTLSKRRHQNLPCTAEAIRLLTNYEPAKKHVGELLSYEVELANLDGFNRFYLNDTRIKIRLRGARGNAMLYMYARKQLERQPHDDDDSWLVRRLDIELADVPVRWKFFETESVDTAGENSSASLAIGGDHEQAFSVAK